MSYAELHAKTNFSFLEGASHPDELVARAAELGYAALAVTDRNSLAGVVRAHQAAKEAGLKLLVGAEITPADAPPVVLWATDRAAYARLARLITRGRRRAEKGQCRLTFDDVAQHAAGLLAGVKTEFGIRNSEFGNKNQRIPPYLEAFGDRCYLLAELHCGPDDQRDLDRLRELSRRSRLPLVAAGDVHYHVPQRQALCDVLTAIRCGCTVATAGARLFANAQRHLQSPAAVAARFARAPEAVRRTLEIAARCTFSLDELRYEYPEELVPPGRTPAEHLARLAWAGARRRWPEGIRARVRQLVEHELRLIEELHYEAYFLTVWDLVRFARRRGILCQGRGSAANSAVCYCLGITAVDPARMDVLFERFVSRERNEAPDIDVDFEHERREEVLQYLYRKYGRSRAGMTAEVITYRRRSAIRDVGKALGLPLEQGPGARDQGPEDARERKAPQAHRLRPVGKGVIGNGLPGVRSHRARPASGCPVGLGAASFLVEELIGFPRHLSQHTGGMVITRGPLCELVPIENAAMPGRTVIQWNKDDLDALGILKVDCLALGMLTAIHKCFDLVRKHSHRRLTLSGIPADDAEVYAMIRRADTMGVFQIESRAQMSMLPRLRPQCFYDLVIEVAIVRPGPIQGNMVHPYLRRRNGEEAVTYPNRAVRRVLEKTLGVPLFQEQAMRLAVEAAGFTPGEADQLRRAMGAWRRPGLIDQFHRKLVAGMAAKGFTPEYARAVFAQIRGFGDYGFPESHAASFALLVYVAAWLKHHYPAALLAALLNSQPMGFYAPAQLVRNAREHGVEVLPVDVNRSDWDCTLEKAEGRDIPKPTGHPLAGRGRWEGTGASLSVRLGLCMLNGLAEAHARRIVAARDGRTFCTLEEFARRTGLSRAVLARLAKAGAFGSLGLDRRGALWHALAQDQRKLPLFDGVEGDRHLFRPEGRKTSQSPTSPFRLPPSGTMQSMVLPLPQMSPAEEVLADYRAAGLSLRGHPMEFLRAGLEAMDVAPAAALKTRPDGRPVAVAGIVLVRQRPSTAKGITFVTLEDETGTANLIVRPGVWRRYRTAALAATVLLARGDLQRQGEIIHVLVQRLEDLSPRMRALGPQSRDFC
jgi:error-prone DNA polymerase